MVFVLLISACSSTPLTNNLQQNVTGLPSRAEISDTPFFPQQKYQCGPAALATVLHFHNQQTHPDELIDRVYIPGKQGSVALEMLAATRHYEQLAYPLAASLEDLLREIAAGHPVLVMQNLAFNWQPQWHYAVVVGYDLDSQQLVLRSATSKRHIVPFTTFERTWRRAGYWALVVLPPDQIPASAQSNVFIKAAQQLEATGHRQSAQQAYTTASKKWPDHTLTWLALGNSYYAQRAYAESENSYRQGLEKNRQNIELWNNLAYSLSAQGCQQQALEALQCGMAIKADDKNLRDSWREISAQSHSSKQCSNVFCTH